jgi:ATP-binding cassette subfamily B (MDR/TAP) protein 1
LRFASLQSLQIILLRTTHISEYHPLVPLPIIGIIIAQIINVFPPSEDDVRTKIYQLLAVGESWTCILWLTVLTLAAIAYFVVTWGWAFCWGIVGARLSRGLRTQMVDRALGLDQTYYEMQCPDVTSQVPF